jgi:hypothetical protein
VSTGPLLQRNNSGLRHLKVNNHNPLVASVSAIVLERVRSGSVCPQRINIRLPVGELVIVVFEFGVDLHSVVVYPIAFIFQDAILDDACKLAVLVGELDEIASKGPLDVEFKALDGSLYGIVPRHVEILLVKKIGGCMGSGECRKVNLTAEIVQCKAEDESSHGRRHSHHLYTFA